MVGLMSLFMIHKAHMPVYVIQIFLAHGRDGTGRDEPTEGSTRGPRGPKNSNSLNCRTHAIATNLPDLYQDLVFVLADL